MATLQEQINELKALMASGSRSVQDGRRSVAYRDLGELERQLARLEAEAAAEAGRRRTRTLRVGLAR